MATINAGRWTARYDEPYVVFLIGMRFNRPWKVHKWGPAVLAMPRMIAELQRQPELGMLSGGLWFGRTTMMVQYWRSFECLEAYAKARDRAHLPAWAAFNKAVGASGDVGVYHETYRVEPGTSENIYVNTPAILFGRMGELTKANGSYQGARGRMSAGAAEAPAEATAEVE